MSIYIGIDSICGNSFYSSCPELRSISTKLHLLSIGTVTNVSSKVLTYFQNSLYYKVTAYMETGSYVSGGVLTFKGFIKLSFRSQFSSNIRQNALLNASATDFSLVLSYTGIKLYSPLLHRPILKQ